ncbi:MAG TPA: response regulator transcription factor [Solirubrobacteraceae bacterium]|nr:response regulator transcription factor [Solirubrobacteraceae bacterium]
MDVRTQAGAQSVRRPTATAKQPTVVLIDDQDLTRGVMRQTLTAVGMQVIGEGKTLPVGLKAVRDLEPTVVVMDVVFGGVAHVDAVERVMRLAPSARVVVLTSSAHHELFFRAISAGARGYLLKNAPRETIARAIRACACGECVISPELLRGLAERARRARVLAAGNGAQGAEAVRTTLTKRELEIFRRLPTGETNREIGAVFSLSENTVKNHVASILTKLHLDNRIQAAVHAVRNGFSLVLAALALRAVAGEPEVLSVFSSLLS